MIYEGLELSRLNKFCITNLMAKISAILCKTMLHSNSSFCCFKSLQSCLQKLEMRCWLDFILRWRQVAKRSWILSWSIHFSSFVSMQTQKIPSTLVPLDFTFRVLRRSLGISFYKSRWIKISLHVARFFDRVNRNNSLNPTNFGARRLRYTISNRSVEQRRVNCRFYASFFIARGWNNCIVWRKVSEMLC